MTDLTDGQAASSISSAAASSNRQLDFFFLQNTSTRIYDNDRRIVSQRKRDCTNEKNYKPRMHHIKGKGR